MIVGAYTMHLHCRNAPTFTGVAVGPHADELWLPPYQWEFVGKTRAECAAQARGRGWVFNRDGDVTCPTCAKKE